MDQATREQAKAKWARRKALEAKLGQELAQLGIQAEDLDCFNVVNKFSWKLPLGQPNNIDTLESQLPEMIEYVVQGGRTRLTPTT